MQFYLNHTSSGYFASNFLIISRNRFSMNIIKKTKNKTKKNKWKAPEKRTKWRHQDRTTKISHGVKYKNFVEADMPKWLKDEKTTPLQVFEKNM